MSVRNRSALLLCAFAALLALVAGYGRAVDGRATATIVETQDHVDATNRSARLAQVRFKIQVQEWKNILLRGFVVDDFEKYQRQFFEEEANTSAAIREVLTLTDTGSEEHRLATEFLRAHEAMGIAYRAGMETRRDGGADAHIRADREVRGIDRAPTDLLDELVTHVEVTGAARIGSALRDARRARRAAYVAMSLAALLFLGITSAAFDVWISRRVRVATRLAEQVAAGDLRGEACDDVGSGEIAALNRNLFAMRDALRSARRAEREHAQAMRDIVDNVPFGFAIVDASGALRAGFTRSCEEIVGGEWKPGASLAALLASADERAAQQLSLALDAFFDDVLPEDLLCDQVPARFERSGRVIGLRAHPIRHEGNVDGVMVALFDDADTADAEEQNARYRAVVELLQQRDAFLAFVADARERLERAATSLDDELLVRRAVHTVKGNASLFGVDPLVAHAHRVEDAGVIDAEGLRGLLETLDAFVEEHATLLSIDPTSLEGADVRVRRADLAAVDRLLAAELPSVAALREWRTSLERVDVGGLLQPLAPMAERIATRLGKKIDVTLVAPEIAGSAHLLRPVVAELPHLVRNAVDHGIEPPDERGGKDPVGSIEIVVRDLGDAIEVAVRDDGRGIASDDIAERAIDAGWLSRGRADRLSATDKLRLVALDGVTTKERATEFSGRGVGIAAFWSAVEGLGGYVQIESCVGGGTTISAWIPRDRCAAAA